MVPPATFDDAEMVEPRSLFKEARSQRATVALYELAILPPQEVAGMDGDQIQKRRLSFKIADSFERGDRVVVHCHSSRMFLRRECRLRSLR